MERPYDCPDQSGNGGGCEPLQIAFADIRRVEHRQNEQDAREGRYLAEVSMGRKALEEVREYYRETKGEINRLTEYVFGGANAVIAKYQSIPPELLSADDGKDIPTSVAIHVPALSEQRIRREERRAIEAEKRAEELGAERERVKLAAKLETERLEREKRNARLIASALATIGMIATALGTYFATHTAQPAPMPPVHHEVTR